MFQLHHNLMLFQVRPLHLHPAKAISTIVMECMMAQEDAYADRKFENCSSKELLMIKIALICAKNTLRNSQYQWMPVFTILRKMEHYCQ